MKWHEIVKALVEIRMDLEFLEVFRLPKTKGKEKIIMKRKIVELKKKESELIQMKIDYKMY